jgi:beta-N-acetylhexosaminidase
MADRCDYARVYDQFLLLFAKRFRLRQTFRHRGFFLRTADHPDMGDHRRCRVVALLADCRAIAGNRADGPQGLYIAVRTECKALYCHGAGVYSAIAGAGKLYACHGSVFRYFRDSVSGFGCDPCRAETSHDSKRGRMKNSKPVIVSCSGPVLTTDEVNFFAEFKPFGFILFGRNIIDKAQLKVLCAELREAVGWDCPILIDQEGGKVRRMKPPHWPDYPAMKEIGDLDDKNRLIETVRGISADLREVGIDVDCAPVLDVLFPETHEAIGTRAFSSDPDIVGSLGLLACEVFLDEGIMPVLKHMPGQGRSALDSHKDLPVVKACLAELEAVDFRPFRHVIAHFAGAPSPSIPLPEGRGKGRGMPIWAMISHIVYEAMDAEHPASTSSKVIEFVRKELGFKGLLVSDDLCMEALCRYGSPADRVAKTLEAGMDIALYCAGHLSEMIDIAKACPPLRDESLKRYNASRRWKS